MRVLEVGGNGGKVAIGGWGVFSSKNLIKRRREVVGGMAGKSALRDFAVVWVWNVG